MSTDVVFKFVSLRPPVAIGDVSDMGAIAAEEEELGAINSVIQQVNAKLPVRDRLIAISSAILQSDLFLLNAKAWQRLSRSKTVENLITQADNADSFRTAADLLLAEVRAPKADPGEGWADLKLRQSIWASYVATLFSQQERGWETRFFLNLIRIVYAYRQFKSLGCDANVPNLTKTRVALPDSIGTILASRRLSQPNESSQPSQGSTTTVSPQAVRQEVTALNHVLQVLEKAKQQKLTRLAQATQETLGNPRRGLANVAGVAPQGGGILLALDHSTVPLAGNLNRLSLDEIEDAEAVKTLQKYNLNPEVDVATIQQKITELIAGRLQAAKVSNTQTMATWENGTFVRVHIPKFFANGGET